MKGPGVRIDLDVRRTWRCPRCGRTAKFLGDVVALRCTCSSEPVWMQLTDLQRRPRAVQHAVVRPATADEAADAFDEQPQVAEGGPVASAELSAAIATAVAATEVAAEIAAVEPAIVVTQVEQVTIVSETGLIATESVVEPNPEPANPPAAVAPPEDDFGAGLLD